jgi:hypothetical protein
MDACCPSYKIPLDTRNLLMTSDRVVDDYGRDVSSTLTRESKTELRDNAMLYCSIRNRSYNCLAFASFFLDTVIGSFPRGRQHPSNEAEGEQHRIYRSVYCLIIFLPLKILVHIQGKGLKTIFAHYKLEGRLSFKPKASQMR